LLGLRKEFSGVMISKATATMSIATTTGRSPLSPLLTLAHQPRTYCPSDWAMISGGRSAAGMCAAAVRSTTGAASSAGATLVVPAVPGSPSIWVTA
jgi:hypothetical protein